MKLTSSAVLLLVFFNYMPKGVFPNGNKGLFKKGNKLGKGSFKKGHIPWSKGKKGVFSKETIKLFRKLRAGKNHYNWKGGITKLQYQIRNCFKYRQWRSDVFTRDNYICQECGYDKGGILNAHHIKQMALILKENNIKTLEEALNCEELWNINNGRTLCFKCHKSLLTN